AAYQATNSNSSISYNVTVCIPPWPILESPSTIFNVLLSDPHNWCWEKTPLPSQQNPYNPYCVELHAGQYCRNDNFTVTVTISTLPRELGYKSIPMSIEFS